MLRFESVGVPIRCRPVFDSIVHAEADDFDRVASQGLRILGFLVNLPNPLQHHDVVDTT
jgi:hypothetical protein